MISAGRVSCTEISSIGCLSEMEMTGFGGWRGVCAREESFVGWVGKMDF
jgi:hypothetical protein